MLYDTHEVSMDISFLLQLGRNCLLLGSVLKNERILTKFLDCGADVNVKAHVRMYVLANDIFHISPCVDLYEYFNFTTYY